MITTAWSAELDNQLLHALLREWHNTNYDVFGRALTVPVLALDDSSVRLGQWHSSQRLLSLSRPLVRTRSWQTVREVLKHEMAHQFVDEILGIRDQSAHGPAFLKVCEQRHIDARAVGVVEDDKVGAGASDDDDRVMRRLQKLLALAESDNENEAQAAANAAQRLMLEHNIASRGRSGRIYLTRALSKPAFRLFAHERVLAGLLARHFFVNVVFCHAYVPDVGRTGTYVEISGTADNLAMAEWMYAFLLGAAERKCRAEIKAGKVIPRDRLRFLSGFMSGVGQKLTREATRNSQQGLVWTGDPDLRDHVNRIHPHLRSTSVRSVIGEAHVLGRAAGNEVVISRPVSEPASARGNLLGG